ncbi:MAG TPA: glycosyltransferase family 39 protein [Syntrophorhabdaceae bacterium]|nr:glycosyltransferase family 39 protein [Syntrophorhabdaceae bacterium]
MNKRYLLILFLMSWIFFFYGLGDYSLKDPDEGRYAEIPREMVESGDLIVPRLNYVRYFEKPPLFYWTVAGFYSVFGINEWSFRIPCALSAFFLVFLLYVFSKRWFGEKIAFFSSLILASSFGFFSMARIVTLDMFFTLWLSCSLFSFYGFYREKKPFYIYLFYICLALATLTKGIVVIVLMLITIFIFLLTEKKLSFLKEIKPLGGAAIYLAITLPWFIIISVKEREFFYFFFIDQHFLRFFTSKHKRTGNILYFFPVLFGGLFPWSFFLPRAILNLWKREGLRLFLIWSFVVFAFFSVSGSKLLPYILPIFPSLALIIGTLFGERDVSQVNKRWELIPYCLFFAAISSIPFLLRSESFYSWAIEITGDTNRVIAEFKYFFIATSILSILVLILMIFFNFSKNFRKVLFLLSGFSFLFVCGLMFHIHTLDKLNTTKNIAMVINKQKSPGDMIINYGSLDQTLMFYTKQRIIIASYTGELDMGAKYDDARGYFISEEEFLRIARSDIKAFFVVKEKKLIYLKDRLFKGLRLIACMDDRCLFTNH